MSALLNQILIVLSDTTHPGNIGAAARAMKTMGLGRLALVSPRNFPSAEVTARAAGADDVLAAAAVFDTLKQAVAGCGLVYATSARRRGIAWPVLDPAEAARQVADHAARGTQAAIVFGQERAGLSNADLESCNGMIRIPTNPEFRSLNLASAVQLVCYELRRATGETKVATTPVTADEEPVTAAAMEEFYQQLERTLLDIGFLDPDRPRHLMRRMRRLFNRTQLDLNEYNILRGILAAVQRRARGAD